MRLEGGAVRIDFVEVNAVRIGLILNEVEAERTRFVREAATRVPLDRNEKILPVFGRDVSLNEKGIHRQLLVL